MILIYTLDKNAVCKTGYKETTIIRINNKKTLTLIVYLLATPAYFPLDTIL